MKLVCADLGVIDYSPALELQHTLVAQRYADEIPDTLLLLEHPPVFTLGRGGDAKHLLHPGEVPVQRVSRGGDVTFHGPGQLVGYPIVALKQHGKDVHVYLRQVEDVLISTLAEWDIAAHRQDGLTGVWVGSHKIASIGIGVRRWVTFHGFALNVNPDLSYFSAIVPCGLYGVRITSVQQLLETEVPLGDMKSAVARSFAQVFGHQEIVWNTSLPKSALPMSALSEKPAHAL